jgi:hypothetical protein
LAPAVLPLSKTKSKVALGIPKALAALFFEGKGLFIINSKL